MAFINCRFLLLSSLFLLLGFTVPTSEYETGLEQFFYEVSLEPSIGERIDSFNGINVYYNGDQANVFGRNVTHDNYNLGLKYQCVEYVKRYYYIVYGHKMPYTYGHAKELFDETIEDRRLNHRRDLYQFKNGSEYRPLPGDILVFGPNGKNPYGHAGIVTYSKGKKMEIIHQNVGESSRELFAVVQVGERFFVADPDIKGWMRK